MIDFNLKSLIRFFNKIDDSQSCWIWKGTVMKNGYGYFEFYYKMYRAHRLSYELFKGEIPDGMQLDHLCRNRACVNPDHLEIVTCKENLSRGLTGKVNNPQTKKTHCPKGHELTEDNLTKYTAKLGFRRCLICTREYHKQYQRKLRANKA